MLGFDDARSFETHIINNHSFTAPGPLVFFGSDSTQPFEPPPKKTNHGVTAPFAQILLGYYSLKYQHKNRTHRPVQKLPPPGKEYIYLKWMGKQPMLNSVTSHMH